MVDYKASDINIKRLGSFYEKDKTIFRVFAPESKQVDLLINNKQYLMHKNGYYFEIALGGNLELVKYRFINEEGISFRDPFAYYSDDKYSYVLDTDKFLKAVIKPSRLTDIIIYETSVRDFSCDDCFAGTNKRKLLAFAENGLKLNDNYAIGLDYLKQLGITHIQLMPIFSFSKDNSDYNWGYNPLAYNYVEKDYIVHDDDPYAYINELRSVTNELHKNNIRLTLDVVFNHTYNNFKYDLDLMIPGHVYRLDSNGNYANGTYCGNEINSEDPFVRAYICEMISRYIELFDIDGVRLDLMGILDYETVNMIDSECKKLKNDFIVYGEGWNMGEVLDENKRASILNADKLSSVAMFNDFFRDTMIKYISGNDLIRNEVKSALSGNNNSMNYSQSINYVECHDGLTFFDRMMKYKSYDPVLSNIRRCKLALGLVMVARGLPFIQSGQEFLRTKDFVENSYNSGEDINKLDWKLRIKNNDLVEYFKALVEIRRNNPVFINSDVDVSFEDYYDCIIYRLNDIMIIINPCIWDYTYQDGNVYNVLLDLNGKSCLSSDVLSIPAYSMLICKR